MRPALRLAPWRGTLQWATSLALLLLPFARVGGESALRIDLPTRSLLAFGTVLRLEELYLFLLLVIGSVLGLLLLTLVFGRVWCGWACPQTTLADLAEGFARLLGARVGGGRVTPRPWQVPLLHGFYAALGVLVASNLIWYFVSPYEFFPLLLRGALPAPAAWILAVVGAVVYLDLAFVRRRFCRSVCPYGRLQTALVDAGTLTLRVLPNQAHRCIECRACVRSCPTGIDIREGYQVECINCGRCLDACREVMERRGEPGLIGYTFGTAGLGPRALLTPRTAVVALATVSVFVGLLLAASSRPPLGLSVRLATAPPRPLPGGSSAVFFTAYASNRTGEKLDLALTARTPPGEALELRGPVGNLSLEAGARRELDFVLLAPAGDRPYPVVFRLAAPGGDAAVEVAAAVPAKVPAAGKGRPAGD